MAAANDQELETLQKKEPNNVQTVTREYLLGVLTFLESMTGRELAEGDVAFWIERLMKYPKAKLLMLQDYTGRLDNGVFLYLDTVRVPERHVEPTRALSDHRKELGREVLSYCKDMMSGNYTKGQLDEKELSFMLAMRKIYPRVNWVCGRTANNGK